MAIQAIIQKLYSGYLQKKWHMNPSGARLMAGEFYQDYKKYSFFKAYRIHKYGFTVMDWTFLRVTPENYRDYLSNAAYYGMHPINGDFTTWIDDKLTLKYLCAGTALDCYLPEYYFQVDACGTILPLMDYASDKAVTKAEDVAKLLREKGELAIKRVSGAIGEGFYKAQYSDGAYLMNDKTLSEKGFCQMLCGLENYLIIEYLHPHKDITAYCPNTVNCVRYLAGRVGDELMMLKGYIRFGTIQSGFVENYNIGGVLCYLDKNGCFCEGNVIDHGDNRVIHQHPDNGTELKGRIPLWDAIEKAVADFGNYFPQLSYMGFDFVVTDDEKIKLLEINSLTSLDGLQIDGPIFSMPGGVFFKRRMNG